MTPIETLRSFVNTWECDENAHLNVQFYYDRFADADAHFKFLTGLEDRILGDSPVRHVRYHSELFSKDLISVTSAVVRDGPFPVTIVHQMREIITGRLSATALDGYPDGDPVVLDDLDLPWIDPDPIFMARSVDGAPGQAIADFTDHPHVVSHRSVIQPQGCGVGGAVLDRQMIACCSDAAAHVWEFGGLNLQWLDEHDMGRVAVEMKRTLVGQKPGAGALIHLVSQFVAVREKTFSFRHDLIDTRAGKSFAVVEVTGMIIDAKARKVIQVPDHIHNALIARGALVV